MPLTQDEMQELQQIEQVLQQSGKIKPKAINLSLSEQDELQQIESQLKSHEQAERLEEQAQRQQAERLEARDQFELMQKRPEAELGIIDRARYSIEPIKSNRIALLQQQLGKENVVESPSGDLFVRTPQIQEFRPINAEGLSQADFAEIIGATPEIIGTSVGAATGAGTTFGAGSVPGAVYGGALGGFARQAASAALGTPQVANLEERGLDLALSGVLGGVGSKVSNAAQRLYKGVMKKVLPEATERAVKMGKISAKRGIKLTPGQTIGGVLEEQEKIVRETPLFGGKARRQLKKQIDQVVNELKKEIGDFDAPDLSPEQVGQRVKQLASRKTDAIKSTASNLFNEVAETSRDVTIPGSKLKKTLLRGSGKLKLFNSEGKPLPYKGREGVSREAYKNMQETLKPIINAIDDSGLGRKGRSLNLNEVNALRKTLDAQIRTFGRKGKDLGFDDVELIKIRNNLLNTIERDLTKKSPRSAIKFKTARSLWKEYKDNQDIMKELKLGIKDPKEIADEKVLNKIFSDTQALKKFRRLTNDSTVKSAARSYMQNLFEAKSAQGQLKAGTLKNALSKRGVKESLSSAFGEKRINDVIELLEFAQEANISLNPSGTATTQLKQLTPSAILSGLNSRVLVGIATGAIKLPTGGVSALIQATGQKTKRDIGFEGRKAGVGIRKALGIKND